MGKPDKFASILAQYPDLASEPVRLVGFMLREYLTNMLADGDVDAGFGFGEACLDFKMDNQDMRVIVKLPQAEYDQDAHGAVEPNGRIG
jgi:hypothetical protein